MCVQTGKTLEDEARMRMETEELYVKSEQEMLELFPGAPEAIENACKIAQRCEVDFDFKTLHLPAFPMPIDEEPLQMLTRLCLEGLKERYPDQADDENSEARKRLQVRVGYHHPDGLCGLHAHRVGFHRLRQEARHHGRPRARQRGGQHRSRTRWASRRWIR